MQSRDLTTPATYVLLGAAAVVGFCLPSTPPKARAATQYDYLFQNPIGDPATFHVSGPATGDSPDPLGDAILQRVEMANGDPFIFFYKPVEVRDFSFSGPSDKLKITAGSNCTVGLSNVNMRIDSLDGDSSSVSSDDLQSFEALTLAALRTNNLNNYVDCYADTAVFDLTIKFDVVVKDNDPEPDEIGEILYFERGTGDGNSWAKMQAVDENGAALGPWLVIGPGETVQTSPQTTVLRSDQKMGTTAIDVSRLGVDEFQYLRFTNDVVGESAYSGGGDRNPDFKIMVVMTNQDQLTSLYFYD